MTQGASWMEAGRLVAAAPFLRARGFVLSVLTGFFQVAVPGFPFRGLLLQALWAFWGPLFPFFADGPSCFLS